MEIVKQVIFKVGDSEYGIDIMLVSAIEKVTDIIPVPNTKGYIKGIINLRGEVIPVYNIRNKFGLPSKAVDLETKLIITKVGSQHIAFEVDAMREIIEIEPENIMDAPLIVMSEETSYINKVANIKGRLVVLINIEGILTKQEKKAIEEMLSNIQKD